MVEGQDAIATLTLEIKRTSITRLKLVLCSVRKWRFQSDLKSKETSITRLKPESI